MSKGAVNVPPQVLVGAVTAAVVISPGVAGDIMRSRESNVSVRLTFVAAVVLRFLRVIVSNVGSPCLGVVGL